MKIVDDQQLLQHLSGNSLFEGLTAAEREQLAGFMQTAQFEAGETIFSEGDEGAYACFIVEGQLDVRKQNDVEEVLIAILAAGRSIGEMSVIDESPRSASVVARSDGKMLLLYRERFAELIEQHPRVGAQLLLRIARAMSMNLRKTSAAIAELLG
jgi:CRP/FNR family transcriptional regulator, cyclic AMP receptor protein